MHLSRRGWLAVTVPSVITALNVGSASLLNAEETPAKDDAPSAAEAPAEKSDAAAKVPANPPAPGALNDETLGALLKAIGLKPKKTETRYDFTFASKQQDQEWTLSMSVVLSTDKETLWIMAWLDELPRSARDVPRTALLGLLAENDKMGKGKFFSYIPTNRRFALQQIVDNREMTSKKFRSILVDLGQTVTLTYPQWTVSNWKDNSSTVAAEEGGGDAAPQKSPAAGTAPTGKATTKGVGQEKGPATRTAVGNGKELK